MIYFNNYYLNNNINLSYCNFNINNYNLFKFKNFLLSIFKGSWNNIYHSYFKFKNILLLEVSLNSNKFIIKKSIELIFGVKILKVNTIIKKFFNLGFKNKKFLKKKKAYIKFLV